MEKDIMLVSGSCQKSIKDMSLIYNNILGLGRIEDKSSHIKVIKNKNRKKNPSKTNYKNKKKR